MKHLAAVSKAPAMAFCENAPTSQEEAKLCFLLELSTGFFLPVFQGKGGNANSNTDDPSETSEPST